MGRARFLAILLSAGALSLLLPASALAGSYTWNLASDFTSSAPGANPDKDAYGGHPWSYGEGGGTRLSQFSTSLSGGLAGWEDPSGKPVVAINPTASPITNGTATFPPGQIVVQPSITKPAVVAWTSPLSGTVQVTGSVSQDDPGTPLICQDKTTWTLFDNQSSLASGATPGNFSKSLNVSAGESISLSVSLAVLGNPSCDSAGVTFTISAPATAPAISLSSPANGALLSGGQPTFAGSASAAFGASSTVTVRVYSGSSVAGTPLQTITTTRSGSGYSVGPNAALADGTYTAQAEQDDIASPPDTGLSGPVTFQIQNAVPSVKLDSLGTKPLHTSTPTFTGTAHDPSVTVAIYPGASTNSTPAQFVLGSAGSGGQFSLPTGKPLDDGRYTAVAVDGAGGISGPMTFRIKVHGPALTITEPAGGAHTSELAPLLAGSAGTSLGDSSRVDVTLYGGASASGKGLGTVHTTASNGTWRVHWRHQLKLGLYTVSASQSDDAGHTTVTKHSFLIVPAPNVIGSSVSISSSGVASVPIACVATAGATCTGSVLIRTVASYQPLGGGPSGKLRVMFAYVRIPAGQTLVVKRPVQGDALRTLRHLRAVAVQVIAKLQGAGARTVSARRVVRLAGH